jgi:hypothetical protein
MKTGLKTIILVAALVVTALIAVAGWTRRTAAPSPYVAGAGYQWNGNTAELPPGGMATHMTEPGPMVNPAGSQMYTDSQTNPDVAGNPCAQPVDAVPAYATRYNVRTVRPRAVQQAPAPVYRQEAPRRKGRSLGKSAAIVGGSAGVGAAIGALAGGGKGAAIGALAGGGGGFVYDRLTHNRR